MVAILLGLLCDITLSTRSWSSRTPVRKTESLCTIHQPTEANDARELTRPYHQDRITCLRCTATNRRREQCGNPAMSSFKIQKCRFHGSKSTGPKTEAGKDRIRQARMTHGFTTAEGRFKLSQAKARVRGLEDLMHIVALFENIGSVAFP